MRTSLLCSLCLLAACGSEGGSDRALKVTWAFETGDCTSNAITKVKVSWGPSSGAKQDVTFDCAAGEGVLGETAAEGGSYGITAVGLDAGGVARVTHLGTTLNVGASGLHGSAVDLTLRPKAVHVTLTWGESSSACPGQVVLPYTLTLYNPPATQGATQRLIWYCRHGRERRPFSSSLHERMPNTRWTTDAVLRPRLAGMYGPPYALPSSAGRLTMCRRGYSSLSVSFRYGWFLSSRSRTL